MKKVNKDEYLVLNTSAFAIIAVILEKGKLSKRHLDFLGVTTSSACNRLSPLRILESFGYVERERNPESTRNSLLISVTESGREAYEKAKKHGIREYYLPNFSCFKVAV